MTYEQDKVYSNFLDRCVEKKAILFSNEPSFDLPNGSKSDFYIDCRSIYSDHELREGLLDIFFAEMGTDCPQLFAGDETAGIPLAAWAAREFNTGFVYLRKDKKTYGLRRCVEGATQPGQHCVVLTDLINTGNSLSNGLDELTKLGVSVTKIITAFSRRQDLEFSLRGIPAKTLFTINQVKKLRQLWKTGVIKKRS